MRISIYPRFPFPLLPLLICVFFLLLACTHSASENDSFNREDDGKIVFEKAFPGIKFRRAVDFQALDGEENWIFVIEQKGKVWAFKNEPDVKVKKLVLDIEASVDDNTNEEGLLGIAFHPKVRENGYFYLNYTTDKPNTTRISRFKLSDFRNPVSEPESETILLSFNQPFWNHNGGGLAFGPDGYLYIGVGDGGSAGDPRGNGQNRKTLLGSILRIDVDNPDGGKAYGIPADNPFKDNKEGFREEIFAYGLRNPWRITFDPERGTLWTGDVGQNAYEEVDTIVNGGNYGWRIMEGFHCFRRNNCAREGLISPVWEYDRNEGFSITGGYVYRGKEVKELYGKYIYGDYVTNKIWALEFSVPGRQANSLIAENRSLKVSSFGVDQDGELYLCSFNGYIYKMKSK